MIRRSCPGVLLGFAIVAVVSTRSSYCTAQQPPPPPGGVASEGPPGVIHQTGIVNLRLVLGRLEIDPARYRKGSKHAKHDLPTPLEESVCVDSKLGIPSLHYTFQSPHHHAVVDIVDIQRCHLFSERSDLGERLQLVQPIDGPLTIQVSSPHGSITISSPSLLHLQATHRTQFDSHLSPLWHYLLPGPSMEQLAASTMEKMLSACLDKPSDFPTRDQVLDCVQRMRSTRRAERHQAETELSGLGLGVLGHLRELDWRHLDAEQTARLRRVRLQLQPIEPDSPTRLACWLNSDYEFWNRIAAELTKSQRLAVDRHLRRTLDRSLAPAAVSAPSVRIAEGNPDAANY